MEKEITLLGKEGRKRCYPRETYKTNVLYTMFQYKDFSFLYNLNTGHFQISDRRMERMQELGLTAKTQKEAYDLAIQQFLDLLPGYDQEGIEKIYGEVCRIRKRIAGADALETERIHRMKQPFVLNGKRLDQEQKKDELLRQKHTVLFVLGEPEYWELLKRDLKTAQEQKCAVFFLVSKEAGNELPTKELLEKYLEDTKDVGYLTVKGDAPEVDLELSCTVTETRMDADITHDFSAEHTVLLFYGEEGFLQCRNLAMDSIVFGKPSGFYTRAVTNQLSESYFNVVYVPSHWDITEYVNLVEKTRISFWQLYQLWKTYGDEIYNNSPKKLYQNYPQYFMNIYESGMKCPEANVAYPLQLLEKCSKSGTAKAGSWMGEYDMLREELLSEYFAKQKQVQYVSAYFDEHLEQKEIPWGCKEQQKGILVQALQIKRAKGSEVLTCSAGKNLHQLVEHNSIQEQSGTDYPLKLYSNFLFFMTPKLEALYNELREDRPLERYQFQEEHLDFRISQCKGERKETFPLYHKSCIAMKKSGEFLFFRYRLRGGKLKLGKACFSWSEQEVDNPGQEGEVQIYTPYFSKTEESEIVKTYRKCVGSNRWNIVIIQEKVVCVRKGEVLLPSAGVVVSLDERRGEQFVRENELSSLGNGYYDGSALEMTLHLDPPVQMKKKDWDEIEWAYGGGLSLILEEQSLEEAEDPKEWLREEGWMSPLSRQTQESEVQKLEKHPRTAIGLTSSGELLLLVFSGRLRISTGADYFEMCRIAKKLFPNVRYLMNADGGGSSLLGMSLGNTFMELSYPAPSLDSCPGMARPIHTVLCLPQETDEG